MPRRPTAVDGEVRPGRLPHDFHGDVGQQLRAEREAHGISLRELARSLGLSASALSQIETGRSRPSVSTLYAIVTELGLSLDGLFTDASAPGTGAGDPVRSDGPAPHRADTPREHVHGAAQETTVQRGDRRRAIDLDSGVRWERLTATAEPGVDFLHLTYDVGGSSSPHALVRHAQREYGLLLAGRLRVTVGDDEHELGPGDSIAFDSAQPHRLENVGDEPARAVWFVRG